MKQGKPRDTSGEVEKSRQAEAKEKQINKLELSREGISHRELFEEQGDCQSDTGYKASMYL